MNRVIIEEQDKRQQIQEMDVISLSKFVFRYLKEHLNSDPKCVDFYYPVADLREALFPRILSQRGVAQNKSPSDHAKLLEAITLLERRGLVVKDFSYPLVPPMNEDKFIVYLTSIGMKSDIDDEVLLLVDKPEEIIDALEQKVGSLDSVVRQYYLESLRAYQEALYISSVICLGVASERAIHWLAESIEPYSGQYQAKIKQRRSGHIFRLTEYLSNTVIPNIFGHDKKLEEELKDRLGGLGKLYREHRNEAGHPQTIDQSWLGEDQEILLIHFRRHITTICNSIKIMSQKQSTT